MHEKALDDIISKSENYSSFHKFVGNSLLYELTGY